MTSEHALLGGRVTLQRLPWFEGVPPAEAPVLKRVDLPQGEIAQIHQGSPGMGYIAWVELRAGGVRGNHVHERKIEHLYLVAGEVDLGLEDRESRERTVVRLHPGDRVVIPPGVAHAVRTVQPGHLVEFAPEPLAPGDTLPWPLLQPQDEA